MSQPNASDPDSPLAVFDPSQLKDENHYWLDRFILGFGNIMSWVFPILMVAICAQVVLRKAGHNQAWLDDAQWWLYGIAMMAGFAYAITTNSHVRVDIFHQNFSETKKARIEAFGLGWLLLPFLAMMIDIMADYAWTSWLAGEGSDSPNGLHRLYLLKATLPILFVLAALAALSMLRRCLARFTRPTALMMLIAALPFVWFAFERLLYRVFYVVVGFMNPDIPSRRIPREPLFEYTVVGSLGLLIAALLIAALFHRGKSR